MFRRLFWLATGLGAGVTATVMVRRWMRRQVERLTPAHLGSQAMRGLSDLGRVLAEAAEDFRKGAAEREAEIRAGLPA